MTLLWLIVWLVSGAPEFALDSANGWLISMGVCVFLDLVCTRKDLV